jgi:transaldolase
MSNSLEQLKKLTVIVADTGDVDSIEAFKPQDATTNPSLILAASKMEKYAHLFDDAVQYGLSKKSKDDPTVVATICDKLAVNFGAEILKIVPGRVSTEVDARLSFDTAGSLAKAHELIEMYKEMGIDKERVLIKLASTWEGIKTGEALEKEGIHCNMTLLFSFAQAVSCAESNVTLISPFVGRIMDWYKKSTGKESYAAPEDPGVLSVQKIYRYYKKYGYKTTVMGASFRNKEEILELAGVDSLTVAPKLLSQLAEMTDDVPAKLTPEQGADLDMEQLQLDEPVFRMMHNEDAMATEKLAEGIRNFAKDQRILEEKVKEMVAASK